VLSEQARNALLEQCLKLATENKITDGNAWHLDLIQHLPDIVSSGPGRGQGSSSGYNFQKMSGGLDAGARTAAADNQRQEQGLCQQH
jgi:condensin complex subunit 2